MPFATRSRSPQALEILIIVKSDGAIGRTAHSSHAGGPEFESLRAHRFAPKSYECFPNLTGIGFSHRAPSFPGEWAAVPKHGEGEIPGA
jgi:hypothetical protein